MEHVVLERGRVGETWRRRWDSFCLVTPNWTLRLPGHPYDGDDPDGFMPRDEVVAYLGRYAAGGMRLETSEGPMLGVPVHRDGASTAAPGLYFVGVHFLRKRKSALLVGVGEDAAIVARQVASREPLPTS